MLKLILVIAFCTVGVEAAVETVTELETLAYVGRWYQTYTNRFSNFFANLDTIECGTADYGTITPTNITVRNSNFLTETSERSSIEGHAWVPSATEPGKLKLNLYGVPVIGDYWVFELGPKINGQYQYALVTEASENQLFVLARDVDEFEKLYESNVLKTLVDNEFVGKYKGAIKVFHPPECVYLPELPSNV